MNFQSAIPGGERQPAGAGEMHCKHWIVIEKIQAVEAVHGSEPFQQSFGFQSVPRFQRGQVISCDQWQMLKSRIVLTQQHAKVIY